MIQKTKAARGASLSYTDLIFNLCTGFILIYASRLLASGSFTEAGGSR